AGRHRDPGVPRRIALHGAIRGVAGVAVEAVRTEIRARQAVSDFGALGLMFASTVTYSFALRPHGAICAKLSSLTRHQGQTDARTIRGQLSAGSKRGRVRLALTDPELE